MIASVPESLSVAEAIPHNLNCIVGGGGGAVRAVAVEGNFESHTQKSLRSAVGPRDMRARTTSTARLMLSSRAPTLPVDRMVILLPIDFSSRVIGSSP